jgi:hypothetical protein
LRCVFRFGESSHRAEIPRARRMTRFAWLPVAVTFSLVSGCVVYTPFEVCRYWADWNTERHVNAQCESFDHLPPKPARVRLMRWGYNVGPTPNPLGMSRFGSGWFGMGLPCRLRSADDCPPEGASGGSPAMLPSGPPTNPSSSPVPPPAPPAETDEREEIVPPPLPVPPTTRRSASSVTQAGHAVRERHARVRTSNPAWLFPSPASGRR